MRKQLLLLLAIVAHVAVAQEKLLVVNEGTWQGNNGRVSYFEDGTIISNQWFRDANSDGLGDAPSDIIQVSNMLIAISLNSSNIIQFVTPEGKAVGATEGVPNSRRLCADGQYVYVTSYAHECTTTAGTQTFTKGFVAKVDTKTFQVVAATEVGYEPDGIAYYEGHLFVANSGGYAYSENHDYEKTVSVINAESMEVVKTIDTGQANLYGRLSQSGKYLLISSPGDYAAVSPATLILDCQKALEGNEDCFVRLPYASTYNSATPEGKFLAVGSTYSYSTGANVFNYLSIDPEEVIQSKGTAGVTNALPGTMIDDIKKMTAPNGIYVNPYTSYIYAVDAGDYVSSGTLHQWSPQGELLGTHKVYITPAHFLALPPDGNFTGIEDIVTGNGGAHADLFYDLQGRRVLTPIKGGLYIQGGAKVLYK